LTSGAPRLAGALGFASVAGACVALLLIVNAEPPIQEMPPDDVPFAPAQLPDPRFWGRQAFVPDWIYGDALDAAASEHFLTHYWPKLRPQRYSNVNNTTLGPTADTVQIFPTDYWQAVSPDHRAGVRKRFASPIALFAARGESEPVAIGVRTGTSARAISLRTTTLTGEAGTLAKHAVTNRLMLAYPARREPGKRSSETVEKPMVLLKPPANQWTFPPATTMVYIVDFHVPANQPAGKYRGEIVVSVDGEGRERLAVSLTVLPFSLKTNGFHAGAFGATYDIWEGGFSGYTEEMIEMDSRYGFNLAGGFFNKGAEIPFVRDPRGGASIDESDPKFAKFDDTMRMMRRYGMGDVAFWNWGASGNVQQFNNVLRHAGYPGIETDEGKRGFAAICAALKNVEYRHGWPEFVLNPYDEALKDQNAARELIQAAVFVREASPETRLYMTEWRPGYTRMYQSTGAMLKGHKRPREKEARALAARREAPRLNFAVIGANTLSTEARQLQSELGGELWHYGGASQLNVEARLAYGLVPWIVRAEAAFIWANYKGDFLGNGWTLHFAMPLDPQGRQNRSTQGPIMPSVRAIAVREGIDDRKYIETLRYEAITRCSTGDLQFLDTLSMRARKLLTNPEHIGGSENVAAQFSDRPAIENIRVELRERIVWLVTKRANFCNPPS